MATIHETLKNLFGFDQFRDGQEQVIRKILEGKSALAVFPTGSGKSLCYQLAAMHLEGVTVVVSPLIALMKDQIDYLQSRGIPAARLDSSVSIDEWRQINTDLSQGRLKLLYVAPERLSNERFLAKLKALKVALLVIDEAHCISEWGHNFRPDYLKLARLSRSLELHPVLALTATATPSVAEDVCQEFHIEPDAYVHTGFYRPNLTLLTSPCTREEQNQLLLQHLQERSRGPTVVYVTLQKTAETVASYLVQAGFPARYYHAGMGNEGREATQEWFMQSNDAIVVATIAFGMGIDKSNIRYVYHYNLPKSLENYSQEIGRAGRDGNDSTCEILACGDDLIVLENFTYGDTPDAEAVNSVVDEILRQPAEFDISLYDYSQRFDIRPLVLSTLLTYLELEEIIETTKPFYNEYRFILLKPEQEIIDRFNSVRADFLRAIFAGATKAKKWFSIDLEQLCQTLSDSPRTIKTQNPRDRVIAALTYLEEQGDLELSVSGLRQGYRIKKHPNDLELLKARLVERFASREQSDIQRVQEVIHLVEKPGCIVRRLLVHFGEDLQHDCGHCGYCKGDRPQSMLPKPRELHLPIEEIRELRNRAKMALASPRQLTRFLCGLNSPMTIRAKLTKNNLFGSCAEYPFHSVMKAVSLL